MWFWLNSSTNEWVRVPNTFLNSFEKQTVEETLEDEYQAHLKKCRNDYRVYHCFGDGCSAIIDFVSMSTCCGSARCRYCILADSNHMIYKLKREVA